MLVLLGVGVGDTVADADWMADKILGLRVFEDDDRKMNRSVADVEGGLLVVSQFTLFGDCRKGKRPGFSDAARPDEAIPLYGHVAARFRDAGLTVGTGEFGADMKVSLVNDGPVTLLVDSRKMF